MLSMISIPGSMNKNMAFQTFWVSPYYLQNLFKFTFSPDREHRMMRWRALKSMSNHPKTRRTPSHWTSLNSKKQIYPLEKRKIIACH